MSIERRFLGWHRPALHLAVDFLYEEFAHGARWDMGDVIVALPGARAGRRLRELLAVKAASIESCEERCLLIPPNIRTAGDLPEALYEPQTPIATEIESLMAWSEALQNLDPRDLRALFPRAPHDGDPSARLAQAAEVAAMDQELAADCVSADALAEHCRTSGFPGGEERWHAFGRLTRLFDQSLAGMDRISPRAARDNAACSGRLAANRTIVLVGTADLPAVVRRLLTRSPCRTISLIHATADQSAGFDEIGCLRSAFWCDVPIPIASSQIQFVDYPRDQAQRVGEMAGQLAGVPDHLISVALAEEGLGAPIERAIERAGRAARRATGTRLAASAPAVLLSGLAAYLSENRAGDFAALLRHPDLTDWLTRELSSGESPAPLLDLCDTYLVEHLPITVSPGGKLFAPLERVARAIRDLAGVDARERRPIDEWAQTIAGILGRIYPAVDDPDANHPALAMLLPALAELVRASAKPDSSRLPTRGEEGLRGLGSSFSEAVGLLLATTASHTIPPPPGIGQVELIGWLEAHLDDNPVLFLSGFNEGAVPQNIVSDGFLTDTLRSAAGLVDNGRRYARDAYLLSAVLASRQIVQVICGRFGVGNEPLAPSRLLLACDPENVIRRLLAFYSERDSGHAEPAQIPTQNYPLATIPRPCRAAAPIGKLRVTDFRDYLQCPYRFYLKHVLGLTTVDDTFVEMGPGSFGDMLHKVLQEFGRWVVGEKSGRPPSDASEIETFLLDRLNFLAAQRFGDPMHPAVAVQVELLAQRLTAFARFQASDSRSGWTILSAERSVTAQIDVDGDPFIVEGRFDRIDYHPESGVYRILDYKSRDSGCDPEKIHREAGQWIDLQLPLYRRIAPVIDIPAARVEVGFITLPKDLQKVGWTPASWDDDLFEEADFKADEVIRKVRAQEFWPPSPNPPGFDDGFAAICLDTALDRDSIIRADSGVEALWRTGQEVSDGA